ncbi:hypothetical protein JOQ06_018131, partial [Pogonophryne albipinna]
DFKPHNVVLQCQEFPGSHTAEALAAAFREMFRSWGIPIEKVVDSSLAVVVVCNDHRFPFLLLCHSWVPVFAAEEEHVPPPFGNVAHRCGVLDVIPSIKALTRLLETTAETDHGVKTSKATLLEAIQRLFGDICSQRLYAIATLLDPRYKDRYFPDALKPQLPVLLLGILATRSDSSPEQQEKRSEASGSEPPEKLPRAGTLQAMYEELLDGDVEHGAGSNNSSQYASQMNLYLSEPLLPRSGQPLAFWQDNKSHFPALAEAARAYLSSPCTSVDSERLFSTAANVVDEKRNRLTSKNAEILIFINKNLPLMRMK